MPPTPKGLGAWILRDPLQNRRVLGVSPYIWHMPYPGNFAVAKWDENKFEVSLGRLRSPSGSRRAVGFFEQAKRGAKTVQRKASYGRTSRSNVKAMSFQRRVIVKVSIKPIGSSGFAAFRKHLDYIQRDGTDEKGKRAEIYGRSVEEIGSQKSEPKLDVTEHESDQKDLTKAFAESCKGDRHHFRIIISPEDGQKLSDLKAYTRDLVMRMEQDLDTKLEWVAADHYDTGQPHTHLIIRGVRDNGKDLVIPKRYIAHTLRERAQELVEIELGPVSQMQGRVRMAKSIEAQTATGLDTTLEGKIEGGVIDMSAPVPKGRVWHRQLQVRRLRALERMGLAERLGSGRWAVDPSFTRTLRDMHGRTQMVKAIHRSLEQTGQSVRLVTGENQYDPSDVAAKSVTGVVQHYGRPDDTREGGFVVVQNLRGEPVYAKVTDDETFETLRKGQIVTFQPHQQGPRKIDHSIADFAKSNDGLYSEVHHVTGGGNVSPAYAQAHVRRLEALRRKKLVARNQDGAWRIPQDYLQRASNYEADKAMRMPTSVARGSTQTLSQMQRARGVTWLDTQLAENGLDGLGETTIQQALANRKIVLQKMGFKLSKGGRLPIKALDELREMDLRDAAGKLSGTINKPYAALGDSRSVEGVFRETINRPSGKFAVIEGSKEFTLVPWRPVMERRLGRSISGRVSAGGISWDVSKQRGLSR